MVLISETLVLLLTFQNLIPFAVVGSTDFVQKSGKKIRARNYPWGVVEGMYVCTYIFY